MIRKQGLRENTRLVQEFTSRNKFIVGRHEYHQKHIVSPQQQIKYLAADENSSAILEFLKTTTTGFSIKPNKKQRIGIVNAYAPKVFNASRVLVAISKVEFFTIEEDSETYLAVTYIDNSTRWFMDKKFYYSNSKQIYITFAPSEYVDYRLEDRSQVSIDAISNRILNSLNSNPKYTIAQNDEETKAIMDFLINQNLLSSPLKGGTCNRKFSPTSETFSSKINGANKARKIWLDRQGKKYVKFKTPDGTFQMRKLRV
jgi:hypothetical protein